MFNLEYPITTSQRGYPGKINLRADQDHIVSTFSKAPVAVCLANNHIMDYGERGFRDTIEHLHERGIRYYGAGYLSTNCNNPLLLEIHGEMVGLMGYVCKSSSPVFAHGSLPGVVPISVGRIREDMQAARRGGASAIVVSFHWGAEEVYLPKPQDITLAREVADLGADLVIGVHAHRIQPFEMYNETYIFYGLGNCVFPALDVPAQFNERGEASERHVRHQFPWNKYSLAVTYYVGERRVETARLLFHDGELALSPCDTNKYRLQPRHFGSWEAAFKRSYVAGKARAKALRYMRSPRMVRLRDVKALVATLRDKEYK